MSEHNNLRSLSINLILENHSNHVIKWFIELTKDLQITKVASNSLLIDSIYYTIDARGEKEWLFYVTDFGLMYCSISKYWTVFPVDGAYWDEVSESTKLLVYHILNKVVIEPTYNSFGNYTIVSNMLNDSSV